MVKQLMSALRSLNPDLILFNGNVICVDKEFSFAEAIAVKDERIIAVGDQYTHQSFGG